MWLMFLRASGKTEPDADGMYDLSEIGFAPEKTWTRMTPYSLAKPTRTQQKSYNRNWFRRN
jgi:hypothetical protein